MQEPLTFPQTVFSKPQYNRRQALPLITDEEQAVELNQECGTFLFLVWFTHKHGFPLMYKIYSVRGLARKDARNEKKERWWKRS